MRKVLVVGLGIACCCSLLGWGETFLEIEPNNNFGTAHFLGDVPGTLVASGHLAVGDVDLFQFDVLIMCEVELFTSPLNDMLDVDSTDTVLRLYDSTGAQIGMDDDGYVGGLSWIQRVVLGPGTYYVEVSEYQSDELIEYYQLVVESVRSQLAVLDVTHYPSGWRDLWVMSDSGGGFLRAVSNDPAEEKDPRISPCGTRIAFTSNRVDLRGQTTGAFNIWVMDIDGLNWRQLTNDPADDWEAHWSAHGDFLTFTSDRDGDGAQEIYLIDALGQPGDEVMVSLPVTLDQAASEAPDIWEVDIATGAMYFFGMNDSGSSYSDQLTVGPDRGLLILTYSSGTAWVTPPVAEFSAWGAWIPLVQRETFLTWETLGVAGLGEDELWVDAPIWTAPGGWCSITVIPVPSR